MPVSVLIHMNSNLDSFYDSVRGYLDAKYHAPFNNFDTSRQLSDAEIGEIESLSSYASHASDGIDYCEGDQYVDGIHIERLIT